MVPTNMGILRNVNFLNLVQMALIEAIKTIIWTLPFLNTPLMYNHTRIFFFSNQIRELISNIILFELKNSVAIFATTFGFAGQVHLKKNSSFKTNGYFTDNYNHLLVILVKMSINKHFGKSGNSLEKHFKSLLITKKYLQLPLLLYFFSSFSSAFFGRIAKAFLSLIGCWCRWVGQYPRTHWKERMW